MSEPICPKCKEARASRIKRVGFLKSFLLAKFGYFPWECGGCRTVFMAKARGKVKRRRHSQIEPQQPPVA